MKAEEARKISNSINSVEGYLKSIRASIEEAARNGSIAVHIDTEKFDWPWGEKTARWFGKDTVVSHPIRDAVIEALKKDGFKVSFDSPWYVHRIYISWE